MKSKWKLNTNLTHENKKIYVRPYFTLNPLHKKAPLVVYYFFSINFVHVLITHLDKDPLF